MSTRPNHLSLGDLRSDARAVWRSVLREKTPFLASVITLAIGLGANAAVLTTLRASLAPVPFPDPDALLHVGGTSERTEGAYPLSYLDISEMSALSETFEVAVFSTSRSLNVLGTDESASAERVTGAMVSASYFDVLDAAPLLGNAFGEDSEHVDAPPVALISHGLWTRRFAQDPGAVGSTLNIDGRTFEVLGVMGPDFRGLRDSDDIWMPVTNAAAFYGGYYIEARPFRWLGGVARLRAGVNVEQAQAALDAHMLQQAEAFPQTNQGIGAELVSLRSWMFQDASEGLFVTWVASLTLFLLACANVASILYGRSLRSARDAALRSALGASPLAAARPIWLESACVTGIGVVGGAALAVLGVTALERWDAISLPSFASLRPDWLVFGTMTGVALVLLPIMGWAPARMHASADPADALSKKGRAHSGTGASDVLLNLQIALAVVLVAISTTGLNAFSDRLETELGIVPDGVLTARLDVKNPRFASNDEYRGLIRSMTDHIAAQPGVEAVAFVGPALPTDDWNSTTVSLEENVEAGLEPQGRDALYHRVTPGYFEALGIPLLQGRDFTFAEADPQNAEPVVVVSRSLAAAWWPDGSALNRRMKFGGPQSQAPWMRVVGIVDDAANRGFDDGPGLHDLYFSILQFPARQPPLLNVVARTDDLAVASASLTSAQQQFAPEAPVFDVVPLTERFSEQLKRERSNAVLLLLFAILATVVCAAGTYGVTTLSVARRRHGHGVMMAMGAPRGRLFLHVLRRAGLGAAPGLVVGVVAAIGVGGVLFGGGASTWPFALSASVVLALAVGVAALPPAGRVLHADPLEVLAE